MHTSIEQIGNPTALQRAAPNKQQIQKGVKLYNMNKKFALEYTTDLKKKLDSRYISYKNGKAKMFSAAESKKRIQTLLKSTNSK